ncbi:MAG: hypothetical protein JNL38_26955 [Myxococcales bacterium]|nr:hypothetical protein [Myxococcales bacterium]
MSSRLAARARTSLSPIAPVLLATLVAACGGTPPPPPQPPQPPPTKPVAVAKETPPDLSPVEEPKNLLVVGRVAKPSEILRIVSLWGKLPKFDSAMVTELFTSDTVGPLIDLDKPVDGAVAILGAGKHVKPAYAISAPLVSLEDAKKQIGGRFKLSPWQNGAVKIEGLGGGSSSGGGGEDEGDDIRGGGRECVLAPAVGPTNGRLVCGDKGGLEALVPYLTRTAAKAQSASDLHVELRAAGIRSELPLARSLLQGLSGRATKSSSPTSEREIAEAFFGDVADYLGDVDTLTLDAQVKDEGAVATLQTSYGSQTSLIARIATASPDKAGPAPAAFWHLPADTDIAFFGRGTDPKLLDHPRELLMNVLKDALKGAEMPDAERGVVVDLATRSFTLATGPSMYAHGFDVAAVEKAYDSVKDKSRSERERAMAASSVGWHLVEVEEPIAKVGPVVKEWAAAYNRPAMQKWMKGKHTEKDEQTLKIAQAGVPKGLPAGTVHIELTIPTGFDYESPPVAPAPPARPNVKGPAAPPPPPKTPPKPKRTARKPIVAHVIAVPDGGRTVVAMGIDADLLAKKAAQSLLTAPETDTLKSRAGLEPLKENKINGAGFVTPRTALGFYFLEGRDPSKAPMSASSPRTMVPAIVSVVSSAPGPTAKGGQSTLTIRVRRETVEDIVRARSSRH